MAEADVAEYKRRIVNNLTKLIKEYPVIGVLNLENIAAPQLQKMRAQLRGKVNIIMSKRRLINIALDNARESRKGVEGLKEKLIGMPALLFTKEDPFKLSKTLAKSRSKAPAKPGQIAPKDIVVTAGATPFAPGPVIGELGQLRIKTGVESGKVVIKEDCTVVKEGEKISDKLASILTRLGIEPMEIGLDLVAAYENGIIFDKKVLTIDEQEFINKLSIANQWAFNLAIESTILNKDTIETLLYNAHNSAYYLAEDNNIVCDEIVQNLISKAQNQALNLKEIGNIEIIEKKEEKKECEEKLNEKTTDDKVAELVKKTKEHLSGKDKERSAEKLVEEIKKEKQAKIEEKVSKEETKENVPKAHELAERIKKQQKDDVPDAHNLRKNKEDEDMKKIEDLTKELISKGSLRK
jgi:large subunit ribosomal protein L10